MKHALAALIALTVLQASAAAPKVACYTNPRTDAMTCIDENNVQEKNGIRWAPVYTGGPNGVRKTAFTLHVNCATGVAHLKDKDGVSFAGGTGTETPLIRALRGWACEAKARK